LTNLGYELCKTATQYKKECDRIGDRLVNLIILTKDWMHHAEGTGPAIHNNIPTQSALASVQDKLLNLNLTLQAATRPKATWSSKVIKFMKSVHVLRAIKAAEDDLDTVLRDFQIYQINHMLKRTDEQYKAILALLDKCQTDPIVAEPDVTVRSSAAPSSQLAIRKEFESLFPTDNFDKVQCDWGKGHPSNRLGKGSFSRVYKGTYEKTNAAFKRLTITKDFADMSKDEVDHQLGRIRSEAVLLARCGVHPNIVQIFGCHAKLDQVERPFIVMELMHINLYMALGNPKELSSSLQDRVKLLLGIASALEFLHLQGIVHRDVKSANILLHGTYNIAKLSDFGEAKEKGFDTTVASTEGGGGVTGTERYLALELILGKVKDASRKAEMHAFGVVLWECLTNKIAHESITRGRLYWLAGETQRKDTQRATMLEIPSIYPGTNLEDADHEHELLAFQNLRALTRRCLHPYPEKKANCLPGCPCLGG
jgi:tRNA A-37 threonylcarbamoyl transferase component Bud32